MEQRLMPPAGELQVPYVSNPQKNVDSMALSDAELQSYGFPTHEMIMNATSLKLAITHAKHHICGTSPDSLGRKSVPPHPNTASCPAPTSECHDPYWAGNIAQGSRGTYRVATIDFVVPRLTGNCNTDASFWTGVGGYTNLAGGNPVLVQAGVDSNKYCGGSGLGQYNMSFWEVYPYNQEQNLPLDRLNVGDEVYAYAQSNFNNNGQNYFFIENETTGGYNSYSSSSQPFSDSATAECVVERPQEPNSSARYYLANFGTTNLNFCTAETNSSAGLIPIAQWPHHYDDMYNGNTLLASVGPINSSGEGFPVTWHASS